jgi:ABC-type antimicrobial peptide transport system permease subunit
VERRNEQVYFPLAQAFRNPVAYVVRTTGPPADLAAAARQALRRADPRLPIYEAQPLMAFVERARGVQRFTMVLVATFAIVSVVLASVGLYGVVAFVVVQRRREYGVRMALGATRGQIMALVLGEGFRLLAAGGVLGVAVSLATGHLIRTQLYGVGPVDGTTYAAALPLLAVAAAAACWWPARRAVAADILDVLRAE